MLLWNRIQASHSPPLGLTTLPTSQDNSSSWYWTSGQGGPIWGSNYSHPMENFYPCNLPFPESPPWDTGPNLISCFPFYPIPCGSFLQPWLDRNLSASFQLVFNENCSTCKCTFDMFDGEGEFHILLPHHHDLLSWIYIFSLNV